MVKKGRFFLILFLAVVGFEGVCLGCGGRVRVNIEPIDSPGAAGVPFLVTITSFEEIWSPINLFLDDTTHTILPKRIPEFMGRWEGLVTITKSGTTSITVSTGIIDAASNKFFIEPAPPSRFIFYPATHIIEATPGESISIKAKLVDNHNNPIKEKECIWDVLSLGGQRGTLSTQTAITDDKGEVSVTYSLPPDKEHLAIIEIETKNDPMVWGVSGKIKKED